MLQENAEMITKNIFETCRSAGRDPKNITVVAVTKSVDLRQTEEILNLGFEHLAENRVDSFLKKKASLAQEYHPIWHFIGNLQRRKVKYVINEIDFFHALDSLSLAAEIQKRAEKTIKCFVEVNVSGEASKQGIKPDDIEIFIDQLSEFDKIEIVGLMTMAPLEATESEIRTYFAKLKEIQKVVQVMKLDYAPCKELSMGMSQDYPLAILEGATYLRIGTAFFN